MGTLQLSESEIETLIYKNPWLLDDRYVIANIRGSQFKGRQVNVGRDRSRFVDLLFKDTRDDRPVIVELKNTSLQREHLAQILEYRALVTYMPEDRRDEWQQAFGDNYYAPKLILIGVDTSEEVRISANLAGVEIRLLTGVEVSEVDFNAVNNINEKLEEWDAFLKSGNQTLLDRNQWIKDINTCIAEVVQEFTDKGLLAVKKYPARGYFNDFVFPFLNIPIECEQGMLLGLFEYFDEYTLYSSESFYCDFIHGDATEEAMRKLEKALDKKDYVIHMVENDRITVRLPRELLSDFDGFKGKLRDLISDALQLCTAV